MRTCYITILVMHVNKLRGKIRTAECSNVT